MTRYFVLEDDDYSIISGCDRMSPYLHTYENSGHAANFASYFCGAGSRHVASRAKDNLAYCAGSFIDGKGLFDLKPDLRKAISYAYERDPDSTFDLRFVFGDPDADDIDRYDDEALLKHALKALYDVLMESFPGYLCITVCHVSQDDQGPHLHALLIKR